jgi:hypothetical protein
MSKFLGIRSPFGAPAKASGGREVVPSGGREVVPAGSREVTVPSRGREVARAERVHTPSVRAQRGEGNIPEYRGRSDHGSRDVAPRGGEGEGRRNLWSPSGRPEDNPITRALDAVGDWVDRLDQPSRERAERRAAEKRAREEREAEAERERQALLSKRVARYEEPEPRTSRATWADGANALDTRRLSAREKWEQGAEASARPSRQSVEDEDRRHRHTGGTCPYCHGTGRT